MIDEPMIDRRRSLAENARVAGQSTEREKQSGQKLTQQYRPIGVQAIAAAVPYQGQRKNVAKTPAASGHKRRAPCETD
jgi:hypothetical protein